MIFSPYVHTQNYDKQKRYAIDNLEDVLDGILDQFHEEYADFHHIFIKCHLTIDNMVFRYQPQSFDNKGLADFTAIEGKFNDFHQYLIHVKDHLIYNEAYCRLQLLPIVTFVVEPTQDFPYQLEVSSNKFTLTQVGAWLKDATDIDLRSFIVELPFGLDMDVYLCKVDINNPVKVPQNASQNMDQATKEAQEAKLQKLTEEFQQLSDILNKKNEQANDSSTNQNASNISNISDNMLEELMNEATQHVVDSVGQVPETVPLDPDDQPLPKEMADLINSRNEKKMDITANILKEALENGTNPFEAKPLGPGLVDAESFEQEHLLNFTDKVEELKDKTFNPDYKESEQDDEENEVIIPVSDGLILPDSVPLRN